MSSIKVRKISLIKLKQITLSWVGSCDLSHCYLDLHNIVVLLVLKLFRTWLESLSTKRRLGKEQPVYMGDFCSRLTCFTYYIIWRVGNSGELVSYDVIANKLCVCGND